jgi:hypothetical protein
MRTLKNLISRLLMGEPGAATANCRELVVSPVVAKRSWKAGELEHSIS